MAHVTNVHPIDSTLVELVGRILIPHSQNIDKEQLNEIIEAYNICFNSDPRHKTPILSRKAQ